VQELVSALWCHYDIPQYRITAGSVEQSSALLQTLLQLTC